MADVKVVEIVVLHVAEAIPHGVVVTRVRDETAGTTAGIATMIVATAIVTEAAAPMAIARWKMCAMTRAAKKTQRRWAPILSARVGEPLQ